MTKKKKESPKLFEASYICEMCSPNILPCRLITQYEDKDDPPDAPLLCPWELTGEFQSSNWIRTDKDRESEFFIAVKGLIIGGGYLKRESAEQFIKDNGLFNCEVIEK